ncbi:MAG TPA: outer membrane protein assembly factor BamD [Sulfurimonas sp.]|uniref:outer membrane protein assembly factor BamD n=1 Tax=Sulfurimonas sp. TaxID=2022749 RepID=UPI002C390142|nr:outer membrane protein assembly factor BamD [Sulfurimonas sp.]HUH42159.1 outer membrane protein assembly factor BamD [Sulfurimonas sp.]
MISKNYTLIAFASLVLLFNGCSKNIEEYNKPAMYWYSKIVEQVSSGDLEHADNYYSSLQGEHIGSPLLPEATMMLAIAHMQQEEYLLSEHFLDEYIKRYATPNEKEDAEFLKIKAKYKALPHPRRDQVLIDEAIAQGELFKQTYPDSMYYEVVNTMLTRLYLAQFVLNEEISDLYDRLDKPKAAAYYRAVNPQPWIILDEIDRANASWYRAWFEGDGTSSWYNFMIPDTKSVVSRNSISEEEIVEAVEPEVQQVEPEVEDTSSWYDIFNPFSSNAVETVEPEVQKIEPKEEDSSSWYDFMIPWTTSAAASDAVVEVQKVEPEIEKVEVKEDDTSSWYDMFNPFSSNTLETVEPEIQKVEPKEEEDNSSWYDIFNPFSSNSDIKKEIKSNEA